MQYRLILDNLLESLTLPSDISNCNNFMCKSHKDDILNFLDSVIDSMHIAASLSIPVICKSNKKKLPGWNCYVKYYKEKSIWWNDVWKTAGCPSTGQLADIRRYSRTNYHNAITFIKKNNDNIVRQNVACSLNKKSTKCFWSDIRKIKGSNDSNRVSVIDNCVGNENIANLFKLKYQSLYNENNEGLINDLISIESELNFRISNKCMKNNCGFEHGISDCLIKKCCSKLKTNKNDPFNEISTSNIIYGSDLLFKYLSLIFTLMIKHGLSCDWMNRSIIVPIPKDKRKSLCSSSNYRAIALNSIICKLFEYVILENIEKIVKTSQYQFGYKEGHSTAMCSFMLSQTLEYYKNGKSNIFSLFLDASKAFDKVKHDLLYKTMLEREICPLYIRLIIAMYSLNSGIVKWNNSCSESFSMTNGVKQGGVLSPYLFSLYLDPLLYSISNCGYGCHIGDQPSNIYAYANDVVMLAPTLFSLRKMIGLCENYSLNYSVAFNPSKSKVILFGECSHIENINIYMNGVKIDFKNETKHLGFNVKNEGHLYDFNNIINDMYIRTNAILTNFNILSTNVKVELFNKQCMSLYGCVLWDFLDKQVDKLEVGWRKCCRNIMSLSPN